MSKFQVNYQESGRFKAAKTLSIEAENYNEALEKVRKMRRDDEIGELAYDYETEDHDIY